MKQNEQLEKAFKHMIENEGIEIAIRQQITLAISLELKSNKHNLQTSGSSYHVMATAQLLMRSLII